MLNWKKERIQRTRPSNLIVEHENRKIKIVQITITENDQRSFATVDYYTVGKQSTKANLLIGAKQGGSTKDMMPIVNNVLKTKKIS